MEVYRSRNTFSDHKMKLQIIANLVELLYVL